MWKGEEQEKKNQKTDKQVEIVLGDPPKKEVTYESLVDDVKQSAYIGFFLSIVMLGIVFFAKEGGVGLVDFLDPILLAAVSFWLLSSKSFAASVILLLIYLAGRFGWLLPILLEANASQLNELARASIGFTFMSLVFLWFLGKGALAAWRLGRLPTAAESSSSDA